LFSVFLVHFSSILIRVYKVKKLHGKDKPIENIRQRS
jgi:hypothetical protein